MNKRAFARFLKGIKRTTKRKSAVIIITKNNDGTFTMRVKFSPSLEQSEECGLLAMEALKGIGALCDHTTCKSL